MCVILNTYEQHLSQNSHQICPHCKSILFSLKCVKQQLETETSGCVRVDKSLVNIWPASEK